MLTAAPAPAGPAPVRKAGGGHAPAVPVQAKLRVGATDDPLEREADATADEVMRMPDPGSAVLQRCPGGCPGDEELRPGATVRRWPADSDKSPVSGGLEQAIDRQQGAGSPLPVAARRFFEPRFGARFDTVRVHTGPEAHRLATDLSARAFTVGQHIYFGRGEYRPGTTAGQRLLAHELRHTVQQAGHRQLQRQTEEEPPLPTAAELYETYQDDLVALGKELYRLVSESPANTGLVLEVLDEVPWLDRDDVVYWFVQPLTEDQLLAIAFNEGGRKLLGRLRGELLGGAPWPSEQLEAGRIDKALEGAAQSPEFLTSAIDANVPPFPSDYDPIADLRGRVTSELFRTLRAAWSWLESDPSTTLRLATSVKGTVETMRPLVSCVSPPGDDSAVQDLDELVAELGYTVEQLTDQPDQGFEAMRQSFQWVAVELVELDPVFESLEQIRNVGSCALLALGPLAEGLVESLQAIDSAETRRFASRITNNPYFESGFILGGAVGILTDARDLVFKALATAAGPWVALASLKEALQKALQQLVDLLNELVGPRGAEVARELGRATGKQLGAKLAELNKPEGPFMFAFGLGKEIGPAIVYTVLSLLGFEAIVAGRLVLLARGGLQSLKSFERLAPLFKRAPDADLPLPDVTPEDGPTPTPTTGPEPETTTTPDATPSPAMATVREFAGGGRLTRGPDGRLRFCYNPCLDISQLDLTEADVLDVYENFSPFADARGEHEAWRDIWRMVFEDPEQNQVDALREIFRDLRGNAQEIEDASRFLLDFLRLSKSGVELPGGGKPYLTALHRAFMATERLHVPEPEFFQVEMELRRLESKMEEARNNVVANKPYRIPTHDELTRLDDLIRVQAETRARARGRTSDLSEAEIKKYSEEIGYAHRIGELRELRTGTLEARRVGGGAEHVKNASEATRQKHEAAERRRKMQEEKALQTLLRLR